MGTRRLPHAPLPIQGGEVSLATEAARHVRVLRLRAGDRLLLFDGAGQEAEARILRCDEQEVRCLLSPPHRRESALPQVHLLVAPPKGERLDTLIRMTTEAGVASIRLLETERTVVRWPPDRVERKLARLTRIAREAVRQSGRATLPALHPPVPLHQAVLTVEEPSVQRFVLLPDALELLPNRLRHLPTGAASPTCFLAIGPEGGFSKAEVEWLRERGWAPARLGPHVLRVETACAAATALAVAALWPPTPREPVKEEN